MPTARVPGPLGFASISGVVSNTRRPVGSAGTSAAAVYSPPPDVIEVSTKHGAISATAPVVRVSGPPPRASKALLAARGHDSTERTLQEFKDAVKAEQIRFLARKGRHQFEDLAASELDKVEGRHRMRNVAAARCRELLQKARADLEDAKKAKDHRALRTTSIGVQSAYRDYAEDGRAWNSTFAEFYEDSRSKREALRGGPHGDAAIAMFVAEMVGRKAPPGWSNHSNGMAVDFNTTYEGFLCAARKKHAARWRRTWLHPWLVANAASFQFHPLSTEEWHWDYR